MMYTKGEWEVEENESGIYIKSNGFEICDIELRMESSIGLDDAQIEQEANAARIVQCVNGYDEVVGSLDELVWLNKQMTVTDGVRGDIQQRIITRAKQALKNAGGTNA